MRRLKKYKIYTSLTSLVKTFPETRLQKFNRPKWNSVKKLLSRRILKKDTFCDNQKIRLNYKSWDKIKSYYKEGLLLKRAFSSLFDDSISLKSYKTLFTAGNANKQKIYSNIIKLFFRSDIFLWKLKFYSSSYEARQAIVSNKVLVNGKVTSGTLFLKRGDIINLVGKTASIKKNSFYSIFNNFVEIDYYTGTAIVLKDFNDINFKDFYFFIREYIPIKKLIDYIKR
jgi:ribosomal protein S4